MPVAERFANNATTTLSGTITSGATSLVVTSATLFPSGPQFRLLIDSEFLLVTAVAGTTYTVTRGVENTTAAAHSNGATVSQVLTSGGLVGVAGSINLSGATTSIPSAGVVGRLFLPSDGGYIYRDNGDAWMALGPIYKMTPIIPSEYSWVNQGASTENTTHGFVTLSGAVGIGVTGRFKYISGASGSTSGWTAILAFKNHSYTSAGNYGIYLRDSNSGRIINFSLDWSGFSETVPGSMDVGKYNSAVSFSAGYAPNINNPVGLLLLPIIWLRVVDDGVNFDFGTSCNGINFTRHLLVSRTDWLAAVDQVGYAMDSTSISPQMMVFSLQVTFP